MKFFTILDRIDKMNKLVLARKTGTPVKFASQLGVSRTSMYELLDELRSREVPISYSKSIRSFYYTRPFEIKITLSFRPLTDEEGRDISGGAFLISECGIGISELALCNSESGIRKPEFGFWNF